MARAFYQANSLADCNASLIGKHVAEVETGLHRIYEICRLHPGKIFFLEQNAIQLRYME